MVNQSKALAEVRGDLFRVRQVQNHEYQEFNHLVRDMSSEEKLENRGFHILGLGSAYCEKVQDVETISSSFTIAGMVKWHSIALPGSWPLMDAADLATSPDHGGGIDCSGLGGH